MRLSYPSEIDVGRVYARALRRWWWIVAAAGLGALLGAGVALLREPAYLATAEIRVDIDFARAVFLDEDAERHVFAHIQDLILSDTTLTGAISLVQPIHDLHRIHTPADLRERVRLTQVEGRWNLSVSYNDPALAAELANAWAISALAEIEDATGAAERAAELQRLFFRTACYPGLESELGAESYWVCDEYEPPEQAPDLEADLHQAIETSRGLIPPMTYGWIGRAEAPDHPISTRRSVLVFAGGIVGLIFGSLTAVSFGEGDIHSATRDRPGETQGV